MKKNKVLLIVVVVMITLISTNATSQVYKHIDEDGKVHYSDKKPFADAKEEKLKPIMIMPAAKIAPKINSKRQEPKDKQEKKKLSKFTIATPSEGSTLSGTGGDVLATVNLEEDLLTYYQIKFYIDGASKGKVKSKSMMIKNIVRGEHTIYAEMIETSTRRVMLKTPKSTFHMKQHSKK